ncbi:MAG: substrate-binding domain-containing protein [Pseudomonadota bacterium]
MLMTLTFMAGQAIAEDRHIVLASTTSTENSGLLGAILPLFRAESGVDVRVVAVGTGQALRLARNGDADVLLVHHRPSEEAFVVEGFGVERHEVMYNDFVLIGPRDDPAEITGLDDAASALARIAEAGAVFTSRGDNSGTHLAERTLWDAAGVALDDASRDWYREMGSGMGATLNAAVAMDAYVLADRATWVSFANKRDHAVLVEGDPALFNQYAVILVNPDRHPHVRAEDGQAFIDWLLSNEGQSAIAAFRVDGQPLFFPNAGGQS